MPMPHLYQVVISCVLRSQFMNTICITSVGASPPGHSRHRCHRPVRRWGEDSADWDETDNFADASSSGAGREHELKP